MYLELKGSLGYQHFEKIVQLVTCKDNELILDLSGITFIEPYGIVGLISAARYCRGKDISLKINLPQSLSLQRYLTVMNFFEEMRKYQHVSQGFFGFFNNFKKTDKPLLELRKLEFQLGNFENIINFTELLDKRMEMMFEGVDAGTTSKQITTNLIEVCQNLEHSLDFGYVAAQKYKNPLTIQIAVMDLGIGFRGALEEQYNKKGEKLTDRRAIELALKPEISSRPTGGGHGLYRLSMYVKQNAGSELIIRTGTARCHLKHSGMRFEEGLAFYPGTQVGVSLRPFIEKTDNLLDRK
ncbi:hypothetical protein [Paenibacillus sp. S150]|uniref:STAS domain-containing protein n=1 Tax=Paenibacillus sp. S150 TaxID=2749826 RepID=UPI001C574F66|nr:hypothetical protein [Paenibacillus sp. S150]MBW4079997.1 hypothetical protein [Paenibacillus sp. S150]